MFMQSSKTLSANRVWNGSTFSIRGIYYTLEHLLCLEGDFPLEPLIFSTCADQGETDRLSLPIPMVCNAVLP